MAIRLRLNNVSDFGTNFLTFSDGSTTTGTFDSSPPIPSFDSGFYYPIIVNPDTVDEEIVYLQGPWTSGDTSSTTFLRGQEETTGATATSAPWHNGPTTLDAFPTFLGDGSPDGAVPAIQGQTYLDASGFDGTESNTGGLFFFGRQNGDAQAATATSQADVSLPVTITTGTNDEFVFIQQGVGIPETFTIAGGTYATMGDLQTAIDAAPGTDSDTFSDYCSAGNDGSDGLILTAVTAGTAFNGSNISPGANDATTTLGFTGPPGNNGVTYFSEGIDTNYGWVQMGGPNTYDIPGVAIDVNGGVVAITAGEVWGTTYEMNINGDGEGTTAFPAGVQLGGFLLGIVLEAFGSTDMGGTEFIVRGSAATPTDITLPNPANCYGKVFFIYDAGAGTTTLEPFGSETINGATGTFSFAAKQAIVITANESGNWDYLSVYNPAQTVLGTGETIAVADSATNLAADGSESEVNTILASPPAWLDGSGEILEPGLYNAQILFTNDVAFTTPGQLIAVSNNGGIAFDAVTGEQMNAGIPKLISAVFTLGPDDVPFGPQWVITMPTDATGVVTVQPQINQLAT